MHENMDKYREKVKEVLSDMYEELASEEFSLSDDNHKIKMKAALNALQGIVKYMSADVVEKKTTYDEIYERYGNKK